MSLLNILSDKISGSVLGSSRSLSKLTSTTFAEAGTSLAKITNDSNTIAKNSIVSNGGDDITLNAPVIAMRNAAIAADPTNASVYTINANSTLNTMGESVSGSLPGYNNSLSDIQQSTREALSSGVNSYGISVAGINPTISSMVTNTGLSSLSDTGRLIDSSCSAAYGAVTSNLGSTLSNINNTIVNKAIAANKASEIAAAASNIKELPTDALAGNAAIGVNTSTSSTAGTNSVGINYTSKNIAEDGEDEVDPYSNNTDVIYQEVKLYVEGVQIPFESISVSQAIGQLPTAMFQVPSQAGLMDIARYYQPKVHIFYTDANLGGDRLLFWGHIIACNYSHSQQNSNATISFECVHKNALMQQITFEWSAGGAGNVISGNGPITNTNSDQAAVQINNFNSESSLIRALQGIDGVQANADDRIDPSNTNITQADPIKLDKRFEKFERRLIGMPSSIMNLWNQVKIQVYSDEKLNIIFSKMFVPLLEDGIRFFDRLSGHYFLENQIQNSRVEHCNDHARPELSKHKTMLPPSYRLDIASAVQTKMVIASLKNSLGFSGEFTNFYDLFMNFYYGIEYELVTLASPGEIPVDPTVVVDPDDLESYRSQEKMSVETIVKPQIPFYYSPVCNVLLPNMFHTVSVHQAESDIPTRITAISTAPGQATNDPLKLGVSYRAPESIREAVALGKMLLQKGQTDIETKATLRDTTGGSYNVPGKYELGRGVKHKKVSMPIWLTYISSDNKAGETNNNDEGYPQIDTLQYKNLVNLHLAWIERYGKVDTWDEEGNYLGKIRDTSRDNLDPYSKKAEIMAHERLLFAAADYEFTREIVRSKTGNVECIFNPYIVPGYPMDIIDPSPNRPSFHAMCASVTHSISPRSISTSVSFMAAVTYSELSNYYLDPIHPWLRTALCMVNVQRGTTVTEGSSVSDDSAGTQVSDPITSNAPITEDVLFRPEAYQAELIASQASSQSTAYGLSPDVNYDTNTGDVISVQEGIIGNPRAKLVADQFYRSVFGVGSAPPEIMYDFNKGGFLPIDRERGLFIPGNEFSITVQNGGENNDNLTAVGGLRLVCRPIEGRRSIENKFGIKFIDMTPQNYTVTKVTYENEMLTNDELLEPGASLFLEYGEIRDVIESAYGVSQPIIP